MASQVSDSSEEEEERLEDRSEYQVQGDHPGGGALVEGAPGGQGAVLPAGLEHLEGQLGPLLTQGHHQPNLSFPNMGPHCTVVVGTYVATTSTTTTTPTEGGSQERLQAPSTGSSTSSSSTLTTPSKERLAEHTEDIRTYYTTQLGNGPLPWVVQPPSHFENFTIEMVIKEMSSVGQEVKAANELDFREIFRETSRRCCVLVEGSPGYGKTTLARKVAADWGEKADYLAHFSLLVFVYCRDLRGRSLQAYVADTLPPLPVRGAWERADLTNWAEHRHQMLFVLDGLDECGQADAEAINELQRRYSGASVLATSRPLNSSSSPIRLHFTKTVALRGFNKERIERHIELYFKGRKGMAERLQNTLFGHQAYQNLVTCPLLCQLFCYIFNQKDRLSDKVTDVYYSLIQSLIRQDIIRREGKLPSAEDIPKEYEEALVKFGRLCIEALSQGKIYFTIDEISRNLPESMRARHPDVIMGFLVKTPVANPHVFHQHDCYEPLHKTFLEFVAAFYLKSLVERPVELAAELLTLNSMEGSSVEQVLLYTMEMLGERAHHLLSRLSSVTALRTSTMLKLLNAAGPHEANIAALTAVMELEQVTVRASLAEIGAWSNICSTPESPIRALKFQWDPKCDSLREQKIVAFFENLERHNGSVEEIEMSMFHGEIKRAEDPEHDLETNYFMEQVAQFGDNILRCLRKKNLKRFIVNFQVICPVDKSAAKPFATVVIDKIIQVFEVLGRELVLEELVLGIDPGSAGLERLLPALIPCRNLRRLSLQKLSCSSAGLEHLAALVLEGRLRHLHLRLHLAKYWRSRAESITSKHGLQSPLMLADPMDHLGREAFRHTMEQVGEVTTDGEGGWRSRVEGVEEEARGDPVLGAVMGEEGVRYQPRADPSAGEEEDPQAAFLHLRQAGLLWPIPWCAGHQGQASGFHTLFQALKDRRCRLEEVELSQCLFHRRAEYLACLGEALRANTSLTRLKVDNTLPPVSPVEYSVPLLLPLSTNSTLRELDLSSLGVTVQPATLPLLLAALATNSTLRKVDLSRWKFHVEMEGLLAAVGAWASGSGLQELVLQNCDVSLLTGTSSYKVSDIPTLYYTLKKIKVVHKSLQVLNIAGLGISAGELHLHPRAFLSLLSLPALHHLDLSEPPLVVGDERVVVDDGQLVAFLHGLSGSMAGLHTLRMDNWGLRLETPTETLASMRPLLQAMHALTTLSINNLACEAVAERGAAGVRGLLEGPPLLRCLVKHLPRLERLSMMRCEVCPAQVPRLAKALKARARGGAVALNTKHAGRCRVHPEHREEDGLEQLVSRLEGSREVRCSYSGLTGVLRVEDGRQPGILRRLSTLLNTDGEEGPT